MENLCYHSHNFFCDGSNPLEDYILEAISQNVIHYGFSSHSPLLFENKWSISEENLLVYSNQIDQLKEKYKGQIDIFKGLEIDYIPGFSKTKKYFQEKLNLDYHIGSVHLVLNPDLQKMWFIDGPRDAYKKGVDEIFGGDFHKAVKQFFLQSAQMIEFTKPDIIGHFDKVVMNNQEEYFSSEEDWFLNAVFETLRVIKKAGTIVEVNTRGLYREKWKYTFPSPIILKKCFMMNIPIVISSDAHQPKEITALYEETREMLLKIGYRYQMKKSFKGWSKSVL